MSESAYVILEKKVGETPLEILETWRATKPELSGIPLAYAGRLDPMASGQILVLIGEECKQQTNYHHLDKQYNVGILFGAHSDSGDVLGLITEAQRNVIKESTIKTILNNSIGEIELPYPVFSSKTVQGKPLHTWAIEGRLDEIEIPTKKSEIYSLSLDEISTLSRKDLVEKTLEKIELIPPVTDPRKALGNDFRRPDVRQSWQEFLSTGTLEDKFYIADITCICSSGTYMRTLAEIIAQKTNTEGLAFSIHRTKIGKYDKSVGNWSKLF